MSGKDDVVHTHDGISFTHEQGGNPDIRTEGMDLKDIILSEIN